MPVVVALVVTAAPAVLLPEEADSVAALEDVLPVELSVAAEAELVVLLDAAEAAVLAAGSCWTKTST